jgi:hypothetical protein
MWTTRSKNLSDLMTLMIIKRMKTFKDLGITDNLTGGLFTG